MSRSVWFVVGSFVALGVLVLMGMAWAETGTAHERAPRIQGVTLDAVSDPGMDVLVELQALGATHVTVIPYGFVRPAVRLNYYRHFPSLNPYTNMFWHLGY